MPVQVGARREALKVHHTFFILDDNETFVQGNFSGLEDFYRAADLRREESLVYTPPIWSPKVREQKVEIHYECNISARRDF